MMTCRALINPTATIRGVGIHSGKLCSMRISPPSSKSQLGIRFCNAGRAVIADYRNVSDTTLRTTLADKFSTVEHLSSALWGLNIASAIVDVDGDGDSSEELPILDGSASGFLRALAAAGTQRVEDMRPFVQVEDIVEVSQGKARIELRPPDDVNLKRLAVTVRTEFSDQEEMFTFERDWNDVEPSEVNFEREVAPARTFVNESEIAQLRANQLGLGGNANNCVVFSDANKPLNTKLRFENERARHKMIDLLGDFALMGPFRLVGKVIAHRPGHALNHAALVALFSASRNYRVV